MKVVAWRGKRDVHVDTVPDSRLVGPTDAIIEVTVAPAFTSTRSVAPS
jgi:threonine dehydrogenase-like Zn-dependent dehydrogenase